MFLMVITAETAYSSNLLNKGKTSALNAGTTIVEIWKVKKQPKLIERKIETPKEVPCVRVMESMKDLFYSAVDYCAYRLIQKATG